MEETLTADTSGISDPDGLTNPDYGYQWIANDGTTDANIKDATASTYKVSDDDLGKTIKVRVTFTDDQNNQESLTSAATAPVEARPNNEPTGVPAITGSVFQEQTLTADVSGIADADGFDADAVSYQWMRTDGTTDTDIPGATASTYTLVKDDAGKAIKVRVTFVDHGDSTETLTSEATDTVTDTLWSATLTVGGRSGSPGYDSGLADHAYIAESSLSPSTFSLGEVSYSVRYLYVAHDNWHGNWEVTFGLNGIDKRLPSGLVLTDGDSSVEIDDGYFDSLGLYGGYSIYTIRVASDTWNWTAGETLTVSLKRFEDPNLLSPGWAWLPPPPTTGSDDLYGNTPAEATKLRGGNNRKLTGDIEPNGDVDWFRIKIDDLSAGRVRIYAKQRIEPYTEYFRFALFRSDGTCVTRLCQLYGGAFEGFVAPLEPGSYYLRVTARESPLSRSFFTKREYSVGWSSLSDPDCPSQFDDPLYGCQYTLKNNQHPGQDINVEPAWEAGALGQGINVTVVDGGIDDLHPDLAGAVSVEHSATNVGDLLFHPWYPHGTKMAGIIAARHNSIGSRGIAPEATIFNYRHGKFLGSIFWTYDEIFRALTRHHRIVAVSNNSWGEGWTGMPKPLHRRISQAIEKGINHGFYGRGTSYITGPQNRGGSISHFDGKLNHYGVVAVCSVDHEGMTRGIFGRAYGSSLWVCAPQYNYTTGHNNTYSYSGGHSSAIAVVSGVAALVRGANPQLSWRDVKLILAGTARKNDPSESKWMEGAMKYGSNSHRYSYNENYGFGVVDAGAAVELAKSWKELPPMRTVSHSSGNIELAIPDLNDGNQPKTVISTIEVPNVNGSTPGFTEHVEITVDFDHPSFRDMDQELVSPAGTVSVLSYPDPHNIYLGKPLTERFRFASTKNLGENPVGVWELRIADHRTGHEGKLKAWSIKVRGHGQGVDVPADHIPGLDPASPQNAPTDLTAAIIDQTVTLAWQPPAHYGDYVSGYKVLRGNADGGEVAMSTLMEDTASRAATYVDFTTYVTGVEYIYQVVALWDDTESLPSNTAGVTPPDGYSPLNARPTGQPAITGGAHPGETLAVDVSGIDDQNGLTGVSYSYQWLADDTAILGETASTYEVSEGDIGKAIKVRVSFTDDRENQEALTSEATEAVAAKPNTKPTGLPTISGTAQGGQTLTVDTSGIADEDGLDDVSYSYQWMRDDVDIEGETAQTYEVSGDDVGKTIKVRVSFTDDRENQEALTSEATEAVAAKPNAEPTGLPTITGAAQAGQTLTADTSGIADEDGLDNATFAYQWMRDDADLEEETAQTYELSGDDVGKAIKVRVNFRDDWGHEATLTSVTSAAVEYVAGPPGAPLEVEVKAGDTEIRVSWQAPTHENKAPVEEYLVIYREEGGSNQERLTTGLSETIDGLTNGVTYVVHVAARNAAGYGTSSDELRAAPRPAHEAVPEIPEGFTGEAIHHLRMALDWDDVAGTDHYEVQFFDWNTDTTDVLPFLGITISFKGSSAVVDNLPEGRFWWFQVRTVNEVGSSEWTEMAMFFPTREADWENNAPTGLPAITGTVQAGETLTASTAGIADADGLDNTAFAYRWMRDDTDLDGETAQTYHLSDDDVGSAIKVRVTFTDDRENEQTLTSAATAAVEARPNAEPTGLPTITGTAQAGETLTADTSGIADADGLTNVSYSYQWKRDDTDVAGETAQTYEVTDDDVGKTIRVRVTFTDNREHEESLTSAATAAVEASTTPEDTTPPQRTSVTVDGATLRVSYSEDLDEDSTPPAVAFDVRVVQVGSGELWQHEKARRGVEGVSVDRDTVVLELAPAVKSGDYVVVSYSPPSDDAAPRTRDTAGNAAARFGPLEAFNDTEEAGETVEPPSNAEPTGLPTITGTAQAGQTLTANTSGIADADGLDNATFSYQWIRDDTDIAGETRQTYDLTDDDVGKTIKVRVTFTDDRENEETLTSAAAATVEARPNSEPTGLPTISGTVRVDETLTADTSGIADADGLDNSTFSYQWIRDDTDIAGGTAQTYDLSDADQGKRVKVRVSFSDDRDNHESLTSQPTEAVAPRPPLTADFLNTPSSHDGQAAFTFELHFNEDVPVSYLTLRDHAFSVTGGTVSRAQRLSQGSNVSWRITIKPSGNAEVTVILPVTTECNTSGAICASDGRKLFNRNEFTVAGPAE